MSNTNTGQSDRFGMSRSRAGGLTLGGAALIAGIVVAVLGLIGSSWWEIVVGIAFAVYGGFQLFSAAVSPGSGRR